MAHPSGGKWKEFVSAETALSMADGSSTNRKDMSSQLHLQLRGEEANHFYASLFTGQTIDSKGNNNCEKIIKNHSWVETLSSDDSDDEIQVISTRSEKSKGENREGDLHVLLHKKRSSINYENDVVHIVDDEDCSIVSCNVAISNRNPSSPPEITHNSLPFIAQNYWCITCEGYYAEGKDNHERSIIHQVNNNNKTPASQVPSFYISPNNKGYQMLLAQGWDQSKGLGRDGKGVRFPVKTILKLDRSGLGNSGDPARVSHFSPLDAKAVMSCHERKKRNLSESQGQCEMDGKKQRIVSLSEQQEQEIKLRQLIYGFS